MNAVDVLEGRAEWAVEQGDSLARLAALPAGSVQAVVTSPPYFALALYLKPGDPLKPLEIGSEDTPEAFVARLVAVFREVRRVLRDDGLLWVNIGDSYSASGKGGGGSGRTEERGKGVLGNKVKEMPGYPSGSLLGIPWRLAEALRADGWLLRMELIWAKAAPMPESLSGTRWERCKRKVEGTGWTKETHPASLGVNGGRGEGRVSGGVAEGKKVGVAQWEPCPGCKKCEAHGGLVLRRGSWRATRAHEQVFMFAKTAGYWADGEGVKTAAAAATVSRDRYSRVLDDPDEQFAVRHDHETACATGANLRSVLTIGPESLGQIAGHDHYASFPSQLPSLLFKASTSERGACAVCGCGWARVVEREVWNEREERRGLVKGECHVGGQQRIHNTNGQTSGSKTSTLAWLPACNCIGAETLTPVPSVVLDPFCGSGRSGVAARRLGLRFIGIDLNPGSVEMAERQIAAALRETKRPAKQQDTPLFAEE